MIRKWNHLVVLLAVVVTPRMAQASVTDLMDNAIEIVTSGFDYLWPDKLDKKDLRFRLGVGVGAAPDYAGSDNYRMRVLPLIDVRYKDKVVLQGTKLRINMIRNGHFKAGPLINYKFGRNAKNNPVLYGWGDIENTFQLGAFAEMRWKNMLVSGDVRTALKAGMGHEFNGLLAHGLYKNESLTVFAGARVKLSSQSYNQTQYGVTAEQAIVSGLPEFHPGRGISSADLNVVGRYRVHDNLFLEMLIGNMLILGDSHNSPLVKDWGNRFQMIGGLGLRHAF